MSEESRPRPFPEARPPHLPDALTRQSPWILAFGAVALLQVWRTLSTLPLSEGLDAGVALGHLVASIPRIATPLFGVALFWRHPTARTSMPLLVFGLALFATGELLAAFDQPIREVIRTIAPVAEGPDAPLDSPGEFAFRVFSSLLSIFAVLYTAAGLSVARSQPRSASERPVAIWLFVLAIVATVISLAGTAQLEVAASPLMVVQLIVGTLLSVLVTLAWAYMATIAIGGLIAGDRPRRGWGLAALAASILFASQALFAILVSVPLGGWNLTVLQVVGYVSLAAWLLLLVGFALGLPAPPDGDRDSVEATGDPREVTQPDSAAG